MEINVTEDTFEKEVLKSKTLVLIDFWAPWCGPCKTIAPHITALAGEYDGKIKVCKLNIDDAPKIATAYTIMSIPTIMLFKDGKIMEKRAGVLRKKDLEKLIYAHI